MKRFAYIAVILFAFAPAAFADSIQFTINSSVLITGSSPDDSYWGIYQTPADAFGTMSEVHAGVPGTGTTTFSNVSFFLPSGVVVTSATMDVIVPTTPIEGTASVSIAPEGLPPPDNVSDVHIPPTFNEPAVASFFDVYPIGFPLYVIPTTPIIDGNEVSTGTFDLTFFGGGSIIGTVNTQGYNWAGYITGSGQAVLPYSVQIDVDYTPVPEPSCFVLLGTGLAVTAAGVRRRLKG